MQQDTKTKSVIFAVILVMVSLVGCNGWFSEPVDSRITTATDKATAIQKELVSLVAKNKAELNDLLSKAELTAQERNAGVQLKSVITDAENKLDEVDSWLVSANRTVAESKTNGDLIINTIGAIAGVFGLSGIGLGVKLFNTIRTKNAYATGIRNLEKNRLPDGVVNWDKLKIDNADAGINSVLRSARKQGNNRSVVYAPPMVQQPAPPIVVPAPSNLQS